MLVSTRSYGLVSLLLLGSYALAMAAGASSAGLGFGEVEAWPLGGSGDLGLLAKGAALLLGLCLGWGVPGLSLALLLDPKNAGAKLLGRAFGLGVGYVLLSGLLHALVVGHAPGRAALLLWLALPPAAALIRGGNGHGLTPRAVLAFLMSLAALAALLWPKLAHESLNGDGTEAYELARSLEAHPLPRWDMERWEGPGRFGTPAINPFLTNSYLGIAGMRILGRGELPVRLPLLAALLLCGLLAGALAGRAGRSGWAYLVLLCAVYLLWNAYYVGYEPAFADLAEPAATDTLTTALLLAGLLEIASGTLGLGVGFLLLATGVLYSAPVLGGVALLAQAFGDDTDARERGRRALALLIACGSVVLGAALVYAGLSGDLADWVRQIRSEYVQDLVSSPDRNPSLPIAGQLLLMTGVLPLMALLRLRRLSASSRALLISGGVYLALVLVSSYKNLHYLAPLPFLFAPAALEASRDAVRWLASASLLAVLALSWPSPRLTHRENAELGRVSCVDGLDYEEACLGGRVVYAAFGTPGNLSSSLGKHTFVRYALDLEASRCRFLLTPSPEPGRITVAERPITFSVADPVDLLSWRFRVTPVPSSRLFPRRVPEPLPTDPGSWAGRLPLGEGPGSALVLDGFGPDLAHDQEPPRPIAALREPVGRLLVPASGQQLRMRVWVPDPGLTLHTLIDGRTQQSLRARPGWSEIAVEIEGGWRILELRKDPPSRHMALDWMEVERGHREATETESDGEQSDGEAGGES